MAYPSPSYNLSWLLYSSTHCCTRTPSSRRFHGDRIYGNEMNSFVAVERLQASGSRAAVRVFVDHSRSTLPAADFAFVDGQMLVWDEGDATDKVFSVAVPATRSFVDGWRELVLELREADSATVSPIRGDSRGDGGIGGSSVVIRVQGVLRYDFNEAMRYSFVGLCIVLIVASLVVAALVHRYRARPGMKASSPPFLYVVLMGAVIMLLLPISLAPVNPDTWMCVVATWLPHVGYVAIIAPLFFKTFRVYRIFHNKQMRMDFRSLGDRQLGGAVAAVMTTLLCFLAVRTAVSMPEAVAMRTPTGEAYVGCDFGSRWWAFGPMVPEFVLTVGLAVLAARVRDVPGAFKESKYIFFILGNLCFLAMLVVLVFFLVENDGGPDVVYSVTAAGIVVGVALTESLLFLPKLIPIVSNRDADEGGVETMLSENERKSGFPRAPGSQGTDGYGNPRTSSTKGAPRVLYGRGLKGDGSTTSFRDSQLSKRSERGASKKSQMQASGASRTQSRDTADRVREGSRDGAPTVDVPLVSACEDDSVGAMSGELVPNGASGAIPGNGVARDSGDYDGFVSAHVAAESCV